MGDQAGTRPERAQGQIMKGLKCYAKKGNFLLKAMEELLKGVRLG